MGLMTRMVELKAGKIGKKDSSLGSAILVTAEAEAGNVSTPEVWGVAGLWAVPPDGSHGVFLPIGSGDLAVVVAVNNYLTAPPTLAKGEACFGSTTADGATKKAAIFARVDGTLEINGTGKFLVTHAELNTALQGLVTAINAAFATKTNGAGAAGTLTLDITSSKTTTVKTGG